MKTLLILLLVVALAAITFFTRPTKADFERYIRETAKVENGQVSGGQTVGEKIAEQLKTYIATKGQESAIDQFLADMQYDNYYLWTNVKDKSGQILYTGMYGHWFKRKAPQTAS